MKVWPHNDMRDRQLRSLADRDPDHYLHVLRLGDRLLKQSGPVVSQAATFIFNDAVRAAVGEYDREPTPAEKVYALLTVRNRRTHRQAVKEAGLGRVAEEVLLATMPVRRAIDAELRKLSDESKITREDVVQGMLNAVATAATSKELLEAWRELGRLHGYYEETKIRIEQTVKSETTVTHRLEGVDLRMLTDDDLMKHAGAELLQRIAPSVPRTLEHQPQERLEDIIEVDVAEVVPVQRGET